MWIILSMHRKRALHGDGPPDLNVGDFVREVRQEAHLHEVRKRVKRDLIEANHA